MKSHVKIFYSFRIFLILSTWVCTKSFLKYLNITVGSKSPTKRPLMKQYALNSASIFGNFLVPNFIYLLMWLSKLSRLALPAMLLCKRRYTSRAIKPFSSWESMIGSSWFAPCFGISPDEFWSELRIESSESASLELKSEIDGLEIVGQGVAIGTGVHTADIGEKLPHNRFKRGGVIMMLSSSRVTAVEISWVEEGICWEARNKGLLGKDSLKRRFFPSPIFS